MKNAIKIEFTTDTLIDLMQMCYEAGLAEYAIDDYRTNERIYENVPDFSHENEILQKFTKVKSELLIIHNTINQ